MLCSLWCSLLILHQWTNCRPAEQRVCSKRVCVRVIRVKEWSILAHFPPLLRFSFYKHLLTYPPTNKNILFIKKFRVLFIFLLCGYSCVILRSTILFFLISGNVEEADVLAVYLRWGNSEVHLPSEISRLWNFKVGFVVVGLLSKVLVFLGKNKEKRCMFMCLFY